MRAIARIAVNYYLMKNRGLHHLSRIIDVVSGVAPNDGHISYYPPPASMAHNEGAAHLIAIKGDASSAKLYAHIVLFNTWSFYVLLCSTYSGDNVEHIYHYSIPRLGKVHDEDTLTT